jgi:DNA-binding Xre family transcriptional regulator
MIATKTLAEIVKKEKVNITWLSSVTRIPYMNLYNSLKSSQRERELRADELLLICDAIGVDPRRLLQKS